MGESAAEDAVEDPESDVVDGVLLHTDWSAGIPDIYV